MQMNTQIYHVHVLQREFEQRQKRDPKLSLRGFARFIEIDPSALSAIFKGKRSLPKKNADKVAQILNLSEKETILFKDSIFNKNSTKKTSTDSESIQSNIDNVNIDAIYHELQENQRNFAIIAEWEHYAILSLMDLKDFQNDEVWIADRLGIDYKRCREVVKNLVNSNMITVDFYNNVWHKNVNQPSTTDGIPSKALRASHEESMMLAIKKMHTVPMDERSMSSNIFCMDRSKVPMARKLIREFRRKLANLMETGTTTDVYQFQVQLFPLTEANNETEEMTYAEAN